MPVPSQGHYGFHSFPVVDWFCLFIYSWVLTFPLEDCSEFRNFVITLIQSTNSFTSFINVINLISLLGEAKTFFNPTGFKLPVLASIITGQFHYKLFRIMQHRDIFIFNFKTIIHVFRFINCFPFLIPNELTKYKAT